MAVIRFGIAPSEFWTMRPRDYWWLIETLEGVQKRRVSEADRRLFKEWFKGNL